MSDKKTPTPAELAKENEELKAELEALRDAEEEVTEDVRIEVPKDRKFTVDKKEYVFAEVASFWWDAKKVKVTDALKDEKLLAEMVKAGFELILKVTK